MTLLVISPDYASHLLPLATLGTAWRERGERVVIASGPATAGLVAGFGFERSDLRLGRGSNPGVIAAEDQPHDEGDSLRGFFEATRRGAVPTLQYQATERLVDLMWEPAACARATLRIVEHVSPDRILVDHLAFSARLGLDAGGIPYGDVVLGHPTALPVGEEVYGSPPMWPSVFRPEPDELDELRRLCVRVATGFTTEWNRVGRELHAGFPTTRDAFADHGRLVLYNYPDELVDDERRPLLPPHRFLGSTLRAEPVDPEVEAWIREAGRFVYVSFGSFLSVRGDVLGRVVDAARSLGVRLAIASGSTDASQLSDLPAGLARPPLPAAGPPPRRGHRGGHARRQQLRHRGDRIGSTAPRAAVLDRPVRGAAAVERSGFGVALDPNTASVEELAVGLTAAMALNNEARTRLDAIAARQAAEPGPERAFEALSA